MPSTSVDIPTQNTYPTPSYQFNTPKYLLEECVDDAYSMMIRGSDRLQQWIPVEARNNFNEYIAHYSYVVPTGFDGSQSPLEWMLDGDEIGLCDFGTAGMDFDICQYYIPYERLSFSTKDYPLTVGAMGGITYCNNDPRGFSRGEFAGLQFTDDKTWVMSQMMLYAEEYMRKMLRIGTRSGSATKNGNNDGLEQVITGGYVEANKVGRGSCKGESPNIRNAANLENDIDKVLAIMYMAETILRNAEDMGAPLNEGDVCLRINSMMWKYLVENAIATGDFYSRLATRNEFRVTPEYWQRTRDEYLRGGAFGRGVLPTSYGVDIPILIDDLAAGQYKYTKNGQPARKMVGEASILTRTWQGRNILAQQYMDYRQIPEIGMSGAVVAQNGLFRITEGDYNKSCWHWNMEAQWRLVSRMQRLQGRVLNLSVDTNYDDVFTSTDWASPNFFPYEDELAHVGNPLVVPLSFN